ncbi:PREDICTED: ovochymase-2 [Nicrophorus vespilloides]|uniref:Ovochymase-2 n=1 Tax=Nicrophorus vespilloides TaxID=110193 RepID=A0ABM1MXR5_NICVS|nr:PREDICTED: ovochymase-2 [Nicrophorus vespilloides]
MENGVCVPVVECTGNTVYENGRCVPDQHEGYNYTKPIPPFEPDTTPDNTNDVPTIITDDGNIHPVVILPTCAAALKCVQEIYCTPEGFVSAVPVVLSDEQKLNRVPLTECADTSGVAGKCCRDPQYKDPWPSANLVNGIDNGQYREDPSLGQYSIDISRPTRSHPKFANVGGTCGTRHYDTQPKGPGALDAHFAEIPWQAMVLRDSNRSLLCGGAIIRTDAVITSAHCVEGLDANDVLIKGGEWKLGIDEEPLPFQIVKVKSIVIHPSYDQHSKGDDVAILLLDEHLRTAKNIDTICLPKPDSQPEGKCISTGWGKKVLQVHLKDAIMRLVDVDVIGNDESANILQTHFPESVDLLAPRTVCAKSQGDQCKVDHGSALACTTDGYHYTLHGIFSWDTGCKNENQLGGYNLPDVKWIETVLSKHVVY